ncbi:MAG: ABC transporter ATP-binding protein/permease [Gammaproteobacteria bacterium]
MLPYIWEFKSRVVLALLSLILAKLATVGIPLLLKQIVDILDQPANSIIILPVTLLLMYGALRLASTLFNELRDAVFARVRYRAMRRLSNKVLTHLHKLSLRFHLDRKTGNITRDLERGTSSISSILNYLVFNIIPTIAEFSLVAFILLGQYDIKFAFATFVTVFVYITFTFAVTNWRMHFRHSMNALDSEANGQAIDGLLNYETVKYFNNETFEITRYDATLGNWETSAVKSQTSMSMLNFGQGSIIAVGVTFIMIFASMGVVDGSMTLGDLVLVNALMLQLFIPLSFLGIIYRMLKYSLADMDLVLKLLHTDTEIMNKPDAVDIDITDARIEFKNVNFSYQADREILHDVNFTVSPGEKLAIVGPSGSGKSTLVRLLFRFYDVSSGGILIDNQDIRDVTQESIRSVIGIVPQDTVLFNDTIFYNIQYAKTDATNEQIVNAAKMANIHDFISNLPRGYATIVGERGLKLSGGEKQRIAIARVILKNPRILVFDEATSSLDSMSEKTILKSLSSVAESHTTLVIAHRLSTIVDANRILVMKEGVIIESGTHNELLKEKGVYAEMWALQKEQQAKTSEDDS